MHGLYGRAAAIMALILVVASCSSSDDAAGTAASTTSPESVTTTMVDVSTTIEPEPATTTTEAEPATTTEPVFEPPATVTLDDGTLAMEPPNTSYRATLYFMMTAELADGTTQEGLTVADGGKIIDDDGTVMQSFIIAPEGLVDLPECIDLAALSPTWISVYDTFYGEDGGDLTGDAALVEVGIMTNGVLIDRYEITMENIDPEDSNEYETLTEAHVDIAREGGHLVSLVLSGTGFNNTFLVDQSEPRDIVFELNFSEFDTIEGFTTPESCLDG